MRRFRPRSPLRAAVVMLPLAAFAAGCGSAATHHDAPAAPPATTAADTTTTAATTPTTVSDDGPPQLVVCAAGDFYAIDPDSSDTVSAPFATGPTGDYSLANSVGGCGTDRAQSPSPDFSQWAATSSSDDGSTVAGYVDAGTDSFTDLSGHDSSSYSGSTVNDTDVMFSPTGELWWDDDTGQIMHASPSGDTTATFWGHGHVTAFTPNGDPSPVPVFPSPSGKMLAFPDGSDGDLVYVAPADSVTGRCLQAADKDGGFASMAYPMAQACPGTALHETSATDSAQPGCSFTGMIDDATFACLVQKNDGPSYFVSVPFTISGDKLVFGRPSRLTPDTQLSTIPLGVSPDGQTLWYEVDREDGRILYQVPTSGNTDDPTPQTPQIETSNGTEAATDASPDGWLWHGTYTVLGR